MEYKIGNPKQNQKPKYSQNAKATTGLSSYIGNNATSFVQNGSAYGQVNQKNNSSHSPKPSSSNSISIHSSKPSLSNDKTSFYKSE